MSTIMTGRMPSAHISDLFDCLLMNGLTMDSIPGKEKL
tara:strand:+ start:331 stop:444 length:114 start_codon:yes stop_codon:yes gene_type:complete